jgi:hypothetical protein
MSEWDSTGGMDDPGPSASMTFGAPDAEARVVARSGKPVTARLSIN